MSARSRDRARKAMEHLEEAETNTNLAKEELDGIGDKDGGRVTKEAADKVKEAKEYITKRLGKDDN